VADEFGCRRVSVFAGLDLRSPGADLHRGGAAPSVAGLRRGRLLPSSSSPSSGFGGALLTGSATSSPSLFDSSCFVSLLLTRGEINLFSPLFAV
jgi:hypothetical protein